MILKVLTEELALQLTELLLQNDKAIRDELQEKINASTGGGVFNADTHYDFPSIGDVNIIYKAESEKTVYQWNSESLKYEALNITIPEGALDIELINGGSANG